MFPRLMNYSETDFDTAGVGYLSDCTKCEVTEELNGAFSLSMEYPVGGIHWSDIDIGKMIVCQAGNGTRDQPFVIQSISRAMGGKINVTATHISYNASGVLVSGFNAGTTASFVNGLQSNAITSTGAGIPFSVSTDIVSSGIKPHVGLLKPPRTLKSLLIDEDDSFLSLYGGEILYDRMDIKILSARGTDSGAIIKYGNNLITLTQNRTIRDFATAIYPYWYNPDADGQKYKELPEKVLDFGVAEYSDVQKVIPLDFYSDFESLPSDDDLRWKATEWINNNWQSAPPHNLKISYVDLAKTEEYKDMVNVLSSVRLGDTISVIYGDFGISQKYKITKSVYDCLKNMHKSIVVGEPLPDFSQTIIRLKK